MNREEQVYNCPVCEDGYLGIIKDDDYVVVYGGDEYFYSLECDFCVFSTDNFDTLEIAQEVAQTLHEQKKKARQFDDLMKNTKSQSLTSPVKITLANKATQSKELIDAASVDLRCVNNPDKWVALCGDVIVASGYSLKEVSDKLGAGFNENILIRRNKNLEVNNEKF